MYKIPTNGRLIAIWYVTNYKIFHQPYGDIFMVCERITEYTFLPTYTGSIPEPVCSSQEIRTWATMLVLGTARNRVYPSGTQYQQSKAIPMSSPPTLLTKTCCVHIWHQNLAINMLTDALAPNIIRPSVLITKHTCYFLMAIKLPWLLNYLNSI